MKLQLSLCLLQNNGMRTYLLRNWSITPWRRSGVVGVIGQRILNLGTRWRYVVNITSRLFYLLGKIPPYRFRHIEMLFNIGWNFVSISPWIPPLWIYLCS